MAQAASRWTFIVEARARSQANPCNIYVEQNSTVTVLSPSTLVLPCQYHSTNAPYSSSSTSCAHHKDKWAKPGKRPKCKTLWEIGKHRIKSTGNLIFISCRSLTSKPGFDRRLDNVRFVMKNVEQGQTFLPVLRFPLSVSFYQCSTLVFIHMVLLPERQINALSEMREHCIEKYLVFK
jgi:hypothetical protein